ncbi:copper homeostasis protein CutC [Cellulosimicrobium marinum]|uniref:copper homeostasis protein CutC n=1 Tax=Cellulosimicrobium marinum TaxID=1638992 RepID=UPI001E2892FD|nr:copper homeostasis protein CutC [Cellulosimicrobium marinum]MCB7135175.1 copper homeostasis protein CutC [Cellulosimicrobium marinum]
MSAGSSTGSGPQGRDVALEIAVQDPAGVGVAATVGARRVELCTGLGATGGLTPGAGLVEAALHASAEAARAAGAGPEVHVLVRPRPGGFVYAADELDVQVREVRAAVAAGAHGVVVGALTPQGRVDEDAVAALVAAAGDAEVTFHRALDVVPDALAALDRLAALGVRRVLTSGGAPRSIDGVDRLAHLARHAHDVLDGSLQVMAGGGVRVEDVPALVAAGVDAVHLSAKRVVTDDAGPGGGGDAGYEVTDPGVAAAARAALDAARGPES